MCLGLFIEFSDEKGFLLTINRVCHKRGKKVFFMRVTRGSLK